ncbi:MAG: ribosome biogenesis GTPase Der [Terrimicrobiaceae bacterium]
MRVAAIIGRPNVGKSALFNRLIGRRVSIVHDQPGVTRDRIAATCRRGVTPFEIVDTGGIGADPDPEFTVATREAAEVAISGADVLLLVVDAKDGMTPLDADLSRQLRASGRPLLLVINKVDHDGMADSAAADFSRLGIEPTIPVSAAHGLGILPLVEAIEEYLPAPDEDAAQPEPPRLAIVGRPNVGKSSLVNAVLGQKRTIVSEVPGTTRDAVDILCEVEGQSFILCDTAGIRHRSRHDSSVEVFSVMRSEETIRRADLCVLVIDVTQGVTSQDKKIAGLIQKAGKACIIVLNKWDLVESETDSRRDAMADRLEKARAELFFLRYAPLVTLSAKAGTHLRRLFTTIEKVRQHATRRMGTGELNRLLRTAMERQSPPARSNRRFKLLYATQLVTDNPRPFEPPIVLLFVNDAKLLPASYLNYLAARLRERWEFPGLPLHIRLRGRQKTAE